MGQIGRRMSVAQLAQPIEAAAQLALRVQACRSIHLPIDQQIRRLKYPHKPFKRWVEMQQLATAGMGLEELYPALEPFQRPFIMAPAHGDFTPWHLIVSGERLVLVDAEHASSFHPIFYDVATFYHWTYICTGSMSVVSSFLSAVKSGLRARDKKVFEEYFLACLAFRILVGFAMTHEPGTRQMEFIVRHRRMKKWFLLGELPGM